ncbi:MAG TPA: hypothetical protein VI585_02730, partial [Candidatus Binatia bacterium]
RLQETAALALALCSMLLGLTAIGPVSLDALSITPKELWSAILLFIGGGVLALGLGQRLPPVAVGDVTLARVIRRTTVAAGGMLEQADGVLRRWPVAGLSLLVLVIMFVWAMV